MILSAPIVINTMTDNNKTPIIDIASMMGVFTYNFKLFIFLIMLIASSVK